MKAHAAGKTSKGFEVVEAFTIDFKHA